MEEMEELDLLSEWLDIESRYMAGAKNGVVDVAAIFADHLAIASIDGEQPILTIITKDQAIVWVSAVKAAMTKFGMTYPAVAEEVAQYSTDDGNFLEILNECRPEGIWIRKG